MLERTPAAARQLASRARRRIQGATPSGRPDRVRQREIVNAWLDAARRGDFDGRPTSVLAFTIADGLITGVDILADPRRLAALDLPRKLTPQGHPR